jgi:hypothetical protein
MQMPVIGRKEKSLNGEEILHLWVQLETLGRVSRHLKAEGRVNPNTGQPFTDNGLWRSAAMYTIENPEKARALYKEAGDFKTDSEWEMFILRRAMQLYKTNRSSFLRWVVSKEWPRKYEALYKDEYGVEEQDYSYFEQSARRMPKKGARSFHNSEILPE